MKIGLWSDCHNFPSLPLMKISAYHKQQGDSVDFVNHIFSMNRSEKQMSEYINKEKAKGILNKDYAYAAAKLLDEVPVEDVVEVVRCKDCKHHGKDETGYWCNRSFNSVRTEKDNFCKFGEKTEKESEQKNDKF